MANGAFVYLICASPLFVGCFALGYLFRWWQRACQRRP